MGCICCGIKGNTVYLIRPFYVNLTNIYVVPLLYSYGRMFV